MITIIQKIIEIIKNVNLRNIITNNIINAFYCNII